MNSRTMKWLRLMVPGCVILQLSTCIGADPEFFFAQTAVSAIVSNVVGAIFQLFTGALAV